MDGRWDEWCQSPGEKIAPLRAHLPQRADDRGGGIGEGRGVCVCVCTVCVASTPGGMHATEEINHPKKNCTNSSTIKPKNDVYRMPVGPSKNSKKKGLEAHRVEAAQLRHAQLKVSLEVRHLPLLGGGVIRVLCRVQQVSKVMVEAQGGLVAVQDHVCAGDDGHECRLQQLPQLLLGEVEKEDSRNYQAVRAYIHEQRVRENEMNKHAV
mmetsp:Transcript_40293/g.101434  ORF Transcript_40293/g.101434 Transcript_40293/m.101434 type:complete len:209 (-) Transcript_40293:457-1083(-)